ncbi:MAG TPA: hypothetical protein VHB97_06720, partial [Polyangia bacterium]|nr:hypothetical protein [Polyangia bacterium]
EALLLAAFFVHHDREHSLVGSSRKYGVTRVTLRKILLDGQVLTAQERGHFIAENGPDGADRQRQQRAADEPFGQSSRFRVHRVSIAPGRTLP